MSASDSLAGTHALSDQEKLELALERIRALEEESRQLRLETQRIRIYTECQNAESDLLRALLDAPEETLAAPPRVQRTLHARRARQGPIVADAAAVVENGGQELGWQERVRAAAGRARVVKRSERRPTHTPTQSQTIPTAPADAVSRTRTPCENFLRTTRKPALRALAASLRLPVSKATPVAELRARILACFCELEAELRP